MTQRLKITIWGFLFVFLLAGYYSFLAEKLPHGAGPDELAHLKAAEFIYENQRLAVYPDDQDELHYSKHGATRSFRPPLVYIASALVHQAADGLGIGFKHPFRQANALIGALCALFLLLALYVYTQRIGLAVSVAAAFALMPQVAFVFSYLNADGGAFMAASLVLLSVCILLKHGVNTKSLALFGVACGILSLSKVTAWVFCLPVCLFAVAAILKSRSGLVKPLLIVFLAFALVGGWRIAFNVYHHGVDNPFNWNMEAELRAQERRVLPEDVVTYGDLEKGYLDLLGNHDNFLSRTYLSFVGHLDWLRLRMGPVQYIAYGILLALGLIAWLAVLLRPAWARDYNRREHWFELSIIAGGLLLFYMYMRFNINNDIQTQGKYLLPAFPGYLLILAAVAGQLWSGGNETQDSRSKTGLLFAASLLVVAYVHTQALYKYVIPFYFSGAYFDTAPHRFRPIAFTDAERLATGDLEIVRMTEGLIEYSATGHDPRMMIKNVHIDIAPDLILVRIRLISNTTDYYSFYWDAGAGMSERTMVKGFVAAGSDTIYQILPLSSITHLRFDLGTPGTRVTIKDLAYAPLRYEAPYNILNRIFLVSPADASL